MGMSANLLSMGAIDFGIIIDGAVVMVGRDIRGTRPESQRSGDAHFQPDVENGAYPADGQRESPRRIFLQTHYYHCAVPIFSFQKVEGKMFQPARLYLGVRLVGSFVVHVDLGAGHVIHVAETERARRTTSFCAFHQREIGGLTSTNAMPIGKYPSALVSWPWAVCGCLLCWGRNSCPS